MIEFIEKLKRELKDNDIIEVDLSKFKFKWSEASNEEPLMDASTFSMVKHDIQLMGQNEPVIIYNNMIVDGRHRQRACIELEIPLKVLYLREQYTLSQLEEFVRTKGMNKDKSKTQKEIQAYNYKKSTANIEWIDACHRYGVKESSVRKIVTFYNTMKKNGYESDFNKVKEALFQNFVLLPSNYIWLENPTQTFYGALKQFKAYIEMEEMSKADDFIDPTEFDTETGEALVKKENALIEKVTDEDKDKIILSQKERIDVLEANIKKLQKIVEDKLAGI